MKLLEMAVVAIERPKVSPSRDVSCTAGAVTTGSAEVQVSANDS